MSTPRTPTFQLSGKYAFSTDLTSWVTGDFDGDSRLDLLGIDGVKGFIGYLHGNGDGTFGSGATDDARSSSKSFMLDRPVNSAVAGDFNKDGKLDLALSFAGPNGTLASSGGGIAVLLGNGNGTFQSPTFIDVPGSAYTLKTADLNGDGNLDFGVEYSSNTANPGFVAVLGNGNGTFQNPDTSSGASFSSASVSQNKFILEDVNGDGRADFIGTSSGGTVSVALSQGGGKFSPAVKYDVGATPANEYDYASKQINSVAAADFNGDGKIDIAAASRDGIKVLLGDGNGNFQNPILSSRSLNYNYITNISSANLNGDGFADLVMSSSYGDCLIGIARGDGTFSYSSPASLGGFAFSAPITGADFNGDGRTDFVIKTYGGGSGNVYTQVDLPPPVISLTTGTVSALEGDNGTTAFNFTVTRSGDVSGASSVGWAVTASSTGATAAADDFAGGSLPSGRVDFAAGETTRTISVLVAGDTLVERHESFVLTLSNPTDATLNGTTARGTILNDDGAPTGGNDVLAAGPSSPYLFDLLAGDDLFVVVGGDHRILGGDGNDTISAAGSTGLAELQGGGGNDELTGGSANDVLLGNAGDDTLYGGAGNDFIDGGEDRNILFGNAGNDTLLGGSFDDNLFGGAGNDVMLGGAGNDGLSGEDGDDRINAGAGSDLVLGGAGNDELGGGTGNDTILGEAGADTLFGEAGDDRMNGGADADILIGGAGNDELGGGSGDDVLVGNEDNDTLFGEDGNDRLSGGEGADTLVGNLGNDELGGDAGDDLLVGNDGADTLFGGAGHDRLNGGSEADVVLGNEGDDELGGGTGNDILSGGDGADVLFGEEGDDTLDGGTGTDILIGGSGADQYNFGANSGADIIVGFNAAEGDRLALYGQSYVLGQAVYGNALLTLSGGGSVALSTISPGQVNAGFFA